MSKDPTDVIVRVTTSGLCGSDLHPYEVLRPFSGDRAARRFGGPEPGH